MAKSKQGSHGGKRGRYGLAGIYPSNTTDASAFRVATTVGAAVGGAALGAAVGKPSMWLGAALLGIGAFYDKPQAIAAGGGMMFVSNNINAEQQAKLPANPTFTDKAKARVLSMIDEVKEQSYVADLIGGKGNKGGDKPLAGLGAAYSYGAPSLDAIRDYERSMSGMGDVPQVYTLPPAQDLSGNGTLLDDATALGAISEAEANLV